MARKVMFLLVPLLVAAGAVWAQQYVVEGAPQAKTVQNAAPTAWRTGLSSDDPEDGETPVAPQDCAGGTVVMVAPRFSTAGATATVEVWLYHKAGGGTYTLASLADVQTATAGSLRRDTASGKYLTSAPLVFPLFWTGAYSVKVRDISGGTVDLWGWTGGPAPAFAKGN